MKLKELLNVLTNFKEIELDLYSKSRYPKTLKGYKDELDLTTIDLNKTVKFITTVKGIINIRAE